MDRSGERPATIKLPRSGVYETRASFHYCNDRCSGYRSLLCPQSTAAAKANLGLRYWRASLGREYSEFSVGLRILETTIHDQIELQLLTPVSPLYKKFPVISEISGPGEAARMAEVLLELVEHYPGCYRILNIPARYSSSAYLSSNSAYSV